MTDQASTAPTQPSDGYIAARKAELAAAIRAEGGLSPEIGAALGDVFRLLGAVLHYEAHERLETLKALYDPLDPDASSARRDTGAAAFDTFESALVEALGRANFQEINHDTVETKDATRLLTGLKIRASEGGIRRIRFFARGERPQTIERKTWFGLKRESVVAQVFNDVIVLVGFKGAAEIEKDDRAVFARMRRGVRPGAALVKHFRNVASAELVTLHPGAQPSMQTRDQVFLAVPALAGGIPVLINMWPALLVLAALVATYFGADRVIENRDLSNAVKALGGLVAVGAFVMRQRLKYEAQNLKYQKQLAETVYFRNLANNAGVLDLLVSAGEDQDAKEAFLAYWILLRAAKPLPKAEIDAAAEDFLRRTLKCEINFEIGDALGKLERLGLVTRDGENYCAVGVTHALAQLDAAWDAYFKFEAAPTAATS
jgi:hypothetical protein